MQNPFLQGTPNTLPIIPLLFNQIKLENYEPAIRKKMRLEDEEIKAIVENPESPSFENTILALGGRLVKYGLDRVTTVLFNLMSAETCDALDEIAEKMMPELSEHSNNISLNEKLFARIKQVYLQKDKVNLSPEERALLDKTYDGFIRNGANLSDKDKETFRHLSKELSTLTLRFSQKSPERDE